MGPRFTVQDGAAVHGFYPFTLGIQKALNIYRRVLNFHLRGRKNLAKLEVKACLCHVDVSWLISKPLYG